jgi:N-acetyltransferase
LRVEPVVLEGQHVRLVPLTRDHIDALFEVGQDPAIWAWTPFKVRRLEDMQEFVEEALAHQAAGHALPFTTIRRDGGLIIGGTRFMNIDVVNRRAEIGATWITPPQQRTPANTEAKYLMLRHAFEVWRCIRVELKTHARNTASRNAILRIGAVEEGTFRKHMLYADGTTRDSVYYSIVDDEWLAVKARLEEMLVPRTRPNESAAQPRVS